VEKQTIKWLQCLTGLRYFVCGERTQRQPESRERERHKANLFSAADPHQTAPRSPLLLPAASLSLSLCSLLDMCANNAELFALSAFDIIQIA